MGVCAGWVDRVMIVGKEVFSSILAVQFDEVDLLAMMLQVS